MDRRYAKRKTRALWRNLDAAMADMLDLSAAFEADHPREGEAMQNIASIVLYAQSLLSDWYALVWGDVPSDWGSDV